MTSDNSPIRFPGLLEFSELGAVLIEDAPTTVLLRLEQLDGDG